MSAYRHLRNRMALVKKAAIQAANHQPRLERYRLDPSLLMSMAGMSPDPWQTALLRSTPDRLMLLCSRQSGKSSLAAALSLKTALLQPGSLTLLLSPSLRQSGELFRKTLDLYQRLPNMVPKKAPRDNAMRLELANGSRIESLPGTEGTVRSFSGVALLLVDEASRVADSLYYSIRPMLAVSRGKLVVLSTPYGKRGWFYEEFIGPNPWHRVVVKADQCPRITPEFLAEELEAIGPRWYRQEYMCEFQEAIDSLFSDADIRASLTDEVAPLFS